MTYINIMLSYKLPKTVKTSIIGYDKTKRDEYIIKQIITHIVEKCSKKEL